MPWSLVLADSEVAAVEPQAGRVELRFAAASVLRRDPGGRAGVAGWARGTALVLERAQVTAGSPPGFGRLAEGRLQVDGAWRRELPLPWAVQGGLVLELEFAGQRGAWRIEAEALRVSWEGEASFQDSVAC